MDNLGNYVKAALTAVFASISIHFGAISDLLWLFIVAVTLDYITGIASAAYNRELSSGIGLRGVIKKVGVCAVIAVAVIADDVVAHAAGQLDMPATMHGAIATIVIIWLILNELISILENIMKMNVPLPPFLMSAIKVLKKHTESSGTIDGENDNSDDTNKNPPA